MTSKKVNKKSPDVKDELIHIIDNAVKKERKTMAELAMFDVLKEYDDYLGSSHPYHLHSLRTSKNRQERRFRSRDI
jgi:hypothetical protein